MARWRKRGTNSKGYSGSPLNLGDLVLVLARVKSLPTLPDQVSRPEDWERIPDPKKCFLQIFGAEEIVTVVPVDIQPFNKEFKKKLQARCKGKTAKSFAQALEEIFEAFNYSEPECLALEDYVISNPDVSSNLDGMEENGLENGVGANKEVVGTGSSCVSSLECCSNIQEGEASKNLIRKKGVEKYSLATSPHSDDDTNDPKKDLSARNEGMQSAGPSDSPYSDDDLISRTRSPSDKQKSSSSSYRKSEVTKKRRAMRLYDDDDDEDGIPKTPVHGNIYPSSSISESLKTSVQIQGNHLIGQTMKGSNRSGEALAKPAAPSAKSHGDSSVALPESQEKSEKVHTPSPLGLDTIRQLPDSSKVGFVSPNPSLIPATIKISEDQSVNKHQDKLSGTVSHSKVQAMPSKDVSIVSDGSTYSQAQATSKKRRRLSSVEKPKVAPKSQGEGDSTVTGRPENLRKDMASSLEDSKMDSKRSMRDLIAAAQAKRKQIQKQNVLQANGDAGSPSAEHQFLSGFSNFTQMCAQEVDTRTNFASPGHPSQTASQNQGIVENDDMRPDFAYQGGRGSLSSGTEAAFVRDAFEGMIKTLSRAKESISRATTLAFQCAKYGIAVEVVDLLIQKLESEPSFHRKVDIFFLVDSITQRSHNQEGIAGPSYVPVVQAKLPRLLGAAAPAGSSARENRRQCLKVLRIWLERKILPESLLRHHMNEIGSLNDDIRTEVSIWRPRAERAENDPIRDAYCSIVDEYGSNTTTQLPGLFCPHAFDVDEEDEENMLSSPRVEVNVELAEPKSDAEPCGSERHHHILEDVDMKLVMKDELKQDIAFGRETNHTGYVDSGPMTPEGSPLPLPLEPPSPLPPLPSSPPPPSPPLPSQASEEFATMPGNQIIQKTPSSSGCNPSSSTYIASHTTTTTQANQQFLPRRSALSSRGAYHSIAPHNIPMPCVQQQSEHPHPPSYQPPTLGAVLPRSERKMVRFKIPVVRGV